MNNIPTLDAAQAETDALRSPMERLSRAADAGVTLAGRMAVALTVTRTKNSRVLGGTALASPIFGGIDNDLEPAHRQARKAKRRAKGKAQRAARKAGR